MGVDNTLSLLFHSFFWIFLVSISPCFYLCISYFYRQISIVCRFYEYVCRYFKFSISHYYTFVSNKKNMTNGNDFAFNDTATRLEQISKENGIIASNPPLTKREHFAAMAMQGHLSNSAESDISASYVRKELGIEDYDFKMHHPMYVAQLAVRYADALIDELNKTK